MKDADIGKDQWVLIDKANGDIVLNADKTLMMFASYDEAIDFREKHDEHLAHHDALNGEELYRWNQRN